MRRKVIKIGDSIGITLPKQDMQDIGISVGDKITLNVDKSKQEATIRPQGSVSSELAEWTDDFIKEYRSALDTLAKK